MSQFSSASDLDRVVSSQTRLECHQQQPQIMAATTSQRVSLSIRHEYFFADRCSCHPFRPAETDLGPGCLASRTEYG
jgi:hypothetical protein